MKKLFILIITILVAVGGIFLFFNIDKLINGLPPNVNEDIPSTEIPSEEPGIILDKDFIYF
ncbi:MAG: hypothetical protein IJW26_00740 [Clostridia bacterium]|nr:hypothetical protein [Clostridia bacterium]